MGRDDGVWAIKGSAGSGSQTSKAVQWFHQRYKGQQRAVVSDISACAVVRPQIPRPAQDLWPWQRILQWSTPRNQRKWNRCVEAIKDSAGPWSQTSRWVQWWGQWPKGQRRAGVLDIMGCAESLSQTSNAAQSLYPPRHKGQRSGCVPDKLECSG